MRVLAFSLGFGKRIWGFTRGETEYRLAILPLGGYVKLSGEEPDEELSDDPRDFLNRPRWQRILVYLAGPVMNAILAEGMSLMDDPARWRLMESKEVRVVDPTTGAEKGSKLARFSLIPPEFLWALAEHYGKGAQKYADRNWERGYNWSLSLDALERHLNQWKSGEISDPETGTPHLICVAWHACALFCYALYNKGTNDVHQRPLTEQPMSVTYGPGETITYTGQTFEPYGKFHGGRK